MDVNGFRVAAECRAAGGLLGGDFYRLSPHAPGRIGVVIGDTCGQGARAAAYLATVRPTLDELTQSKASPAEILSELNRVAARTLPLDCFITAAAFEFDAEAGVVTIANAGHVPGIVRGASGLVSIVGNASGPPLGIEPESKYENEYYELRRGDVVVMMTDGLLEAIEKDLWSMETVRNWLSEAPGEAGSVHRLLLGKLDACVARRFMDDVTLVTLEASYDGHRVSALPLQ
ncbi:MAG TPA: PP2C family protein-serine/threonine phosphatase [Polyangiaceae bacterium]|jgi:serine phosphatase RsbU (regulator of sigma subunit)|nr:PP2C family protein-serine/threonine phosphatase [Polyangiaceae bacterium]